MKLVIWDIDGTLVDSHAMIMEAMAAGMAAAGLPELPHRKVSGIVGLSLPVAVETLLPGHDPATHAAVAEGYRVHYSAARAMAESPLFPGARDCLDRLAALDDLLMAVATGKSRRGLDALLAAHGLEGYFTATHCADGHLSKPAPGMILSCLNDSGVDATRAVMIGDTSFDILMAGNAGIKAIGVAWGHHPAGDLTAAGALAVARDFSELSQLIEDWAA
ncbi:HAD-IA family hydrolase [Paracoccus sp. MC1854]|uniref:HAD-IA family hydrolase n=1 Tax=Paracoccus sp. MC1854 TaxID=2760306 RepID=UPI00160210D2|nr:HAD-IA family hydrolase [Paracoccus sp. MC1854]MBB1491085.1 HAD-IA family hydrolase [Paracoccus sp. MC1854]